MTNPYTLYVKLVLNSKCKLLKKKAYAICGQIIVDYFCVNHAAAPLLLSLFSFLPELFHKRNTSTDYSC